jgi:TonB family protein
MKPQAHDQFASDSRAPRARRTEVAILSEDDGFLIETGPLLGDRYRTHAVDSVAAFEALPASLQRIALIDAASVPEARTTVARLEQQHRSVPIIIVTEHATEWSGALTRGAVIAVIKRTELAGDALQPALALAESRLMHVQEDALPSASVSAALLNAMRPPGPSPLRMAWLGAAIVLLAAGSWWALDRHAANTRSHAAAASGTAPRLPAGEQSTPTMPAESNSTVLELLSSARVAFRDQKLLLPRPDGELHGDSALELYTQVLRQQSDNEEALEGIRRLFAIGKARIQANLAAGKLEDSARLVAAFKAAGVNDESLHGLEAGIQAMRPKWLAAHAQEAIDAGDFATATTLMGQLTTLGEQAAVAQLQRSADAKRVDLQLQAAAKGVKAAIDAGTLIEPANDNARVRLLAMRSVSRTNPATLAAQHDLQLALLARTQDSARKEQFETAQRYLAAAADLGASAELADAKRQLQSAIDLVAHRNAAAAQAPVAASAPPPVPAPRGESTPQAVRPSYIAAHAVGSLRADYPSNATGDGHVTLEFTLNPNGSATDIEVVDALPRGMFDQAAIKAVAQGRFDTRALTNGSPRRARIRLGFNKSS